MIEALTVALGVLFGTTIARWMTKRREKRGEKVIPLYQWVIEQILIPSLRRRLGPKLSPTREPVKDCLKEGAAAVKKSRYFKN